MDIGNILESVGFGVIPLLGEEKRPRRGYGEERRPFLQAGEIKQREGVAEDGSDR